MYRITKVLNHNTVLAVKDKSAREYLIVGKGVGFGKKITQSVEPTEEDSLYSYGRSYSICCKAYGKQRTDQQSFKR